MNLLQFKNKYFVPTNKNEITIENFRKIQYDQIDYFCRLLVHHLSIQNENYLTVDNVTITPNINYHGASNSKTNEIIITVKMENEEPKVFFSFFVPSLIDNDQFYINGNVYTPSIYAIDMPIVIKKESIKLWALFNSITFAPKRNVCVFCLNNIPIDYILTLFLKYQEDEYKNFNNELYNKYIEKYDLVSMNLSENDIISFFSNLFKSCKNLNDVIKMLETLFFDEYTRHIYEVQYIELDNISLYNIIQKAIYDDLNENIFNFIDLTNKRLTFIEQLFKPIFKGISGISVQTLKGRRYNELTMNKFVIMKYFLNSPDNKEHKKKDGMAGSMLYDTSNLFSGILKHKIQMISPGVENPPRELQSMHSSHFEKICPISISSQNPGEVVSVIYGTKLDKFGRFI